MAVNDINDATKWEAFCDRLAQSTASGQLVWDNWDTRTARPNAKSPVFVTTYKQWKIAIYKYEYKYFYDEDRFDWNEEVAIDLIDDSGKNEWTIPKVPSRRRLLDQIQFKNADVESLLDDVLGNVGT